MPGKRNLMSMSHMLESLNDAVNKGRERASQGKGNLERKLNELGIQIPLVDVEIKVCYSRPVPDSSARAKAPAGVVSAQHSMLIEYSSSVHWGERLAEDGHIRISRSLLRSQARR
jgi:hypothetical protein